MLQKANTQNIEFGVRKDLLIEKVSVEMGDLIMPQIRLVHWRWLRVFKRLERTGMQNAGGATFNWRTLGLGHLW